MTKLPALLEQHRETITGTLRLCKDNWDALLRSCDSDSLTRYGRLNNEETWTFLVACGYALTGRYGVELLTEKLTGRSGLPQPESPEVWLEFRPMTPRIGEGRTHLDLAVGTIIQEAKTKGGIELAGAAAESWICFCEMKWESDISAGTSNDENRNQLARVIESALYFQKRGVFAAEIYVSLVTPEAFQGERGLEKLYRRKFSEYAADESSIIADLGGCMLPVRGEFKAAERIEALSLRWTTYEDLIDGFPDSDISHELREFRDRYGNYLEG